MAGFYAAKKQATTPNFIEISFPFSKGRTQSAKIVSKNNRISF